MANLIVCRNRQWHPELDDVTAEAITHDTREVTLNQVDGKAKDTMTYVNKVTGQRVGRLRVVRTAEQIEIACILALIRIEGAFRRIKE
jgi:hypothetical protein